MIYKIQKIVLVTFSILLMQNCNQIEKDFQIEYHEFGHSLDNGIEWIVKSHDGADYLFCVNSDHHANKISLSGISVQLQQVEVLKENREIEVQDGQIEDYFEPFAVHIKNY